MPRELDVKLHLTEECGGEPMSLQHLIMNLERCTFDIGSPYQKQGKITVKVTGIDETRDCS